MIFPLQLKWSNHCFIIMSIHLLYYYYYFLITWISIILSNHNIRIITDWLSLGVLAVLC